MKFNYQIRTKKGEVQSGIVEASSKEAALSLLQKQGYYVTYLEEEKMPFYAKNLQLMQSIGKKDIVLFSRQLAMMFRSQIPLVEAFGIISSQTRNLKLKEQVMNISDEIEAGSPFSKALSRYPKTFHLLYIAMVKAGETAGKLSDSLDYIADYLEREYNMSSKMQGALLYPALVFVMSILIIFLMIYTVVPQLHSVIEETGVQVPVFTQNVFKFSAFVKDYGFIIMGVFVALIFLLLRFYQTAQGKKVIDKILLKIPLIGSFLKTLYLARIAETLSTLIAGGLMINQALELSAGVAGNTVYEAALLNVSDQVKKGVPTSSVLGLYPNIFPSLFIQMTIVGEKTGNLSKSLVEVSSFYQAESDRSMSAMLTILEPLLIVILGGMVGGLIFSVLMPLYQTMTV